MTTTILANGIVRPDAFCPPVEAVAITDDRILAVGSLDEVASIVGRGAHVHDLDGATVIPGLVESHVHPIFYGLTRNWADCRSPRNRSIAEVLNTLRAQMEALCPGGWIRGWGYDDTLLTEKRHLTRDDLDKVSASIPIVISHISGHFVVANSAALDLAGVHDETPDPAEGHIMRDSTGRLTGLMWEIGAVHLILDKFPAVSTSQLEEAARYAVSQAASRGMTSIHDLGIGLMAGAAELAIWQSLAESERLPVRVTGYLRGDLATEMLALTPDLFTREQSGNFRLAGAKYWADGSIQGLSAALLQPYSCADDTCGELLIDSERLVHLVQAIESAGGQCAVHANGDRAIRSVVDAFAEVRSSGGGQDARHRIEHLQMAGPRDIEDLIAAGGTASVFANHIYYWGDRHRDLFIGVERAARMNPLAEASAKGLHFGLHSDCPITPMDSLRTLWTAVTRETSSGKTLGEEQRLTPGQALHALTSDSAWLSGDEETRGVLRPGKVADLAVLDRDILSVDPAAIRDTAVLGTMVGGTWVYQA